MTLTKIQKQFVQEGGQILIRNNVIELKKGNYTRVFEVDGENIGTIVDLKVKGMLENLGYFPQSRNNNVQLV